MNWKDEYATGVERVDKQHKMIFQMTHDFRLALEEGNGARVYTNFIDYLGTYCKAHFDFEEVCTNACDCPVAEKNKKEHAQFIAYYKVFRQKFDEHGYNDLDASELITIVERWLDGHIRNIDIHLMRCQHS